MKIYSIFDKKFTKYGQVINCTFEKKLNNIYEKLEKNQKGVRYLPKVDEFYSKKVVNFFKEYLGELEIQIGICDGYNNILNALEWHKTSEVNFAFTDMILLLGDARDFKKGYYDTKKLKAFEVKKGQCFEMYANTLHFCPMAKNNQFFSNLIVLNKDTNTLLEEKTQVKELVKKNKWLVCHPDCTEYVKAGKIIGLKGKNINI